MFWLYNLSYEFQPGSHCRMVARFHEPTVSDEEGNAEFSLMMDILTRARVVSETRSQRTALSGLGRAFLQAHQKPT